MEDDRLKSIEKKLDEHSSTLQGIQGALNKIAVQNEQIVNLQRDVSAIWGKYDQMCGPQGPLTRYPRLLQIGEIDEGAAHVKGGPLFLFKPCGLRPIRQRGTQAKGSLIW